MITELSPKSDAKGKKQQRIGSDQDVLIPLGITESLSGPYSHSTAGKQEKRKDGSCPGPRLCCHLLAQKRAAAAQAAVSADLSKALLFPSVGGFRACRKLGRKSTVCGLQGEDRYQVDKVVMPSVLSHSLL